MIARKQNLRHRSFTPHRRSCILRILQKPRKMAFVREAGFVRQHTRKHSGNTVGNNQCRKLTARQNIVADRNFFVNDFFEHSFVNALVMSAQNRKILSFGKLSDLLLGQRLSLRRHINKIRSFADFLTQRRKAVINRLRLHNHSHSAAVGCIVHSVVPVRRIRSDLVTVNFNKILFSCPSDNAFGKYAFAHFGKKGQYINPHRQKYLSSV